MTEWTSECMRSVLIPPGHNQTLQELYPSYVLAFPSVFTCFRMTNTILSGGINLGLPPTQLIPNVPWNQWRIMIKRQWNYPNPGGMVSIQWEGISIPQTAKITLTPIYDSDPEGWVIESEEWMPRNQKEKWWILPDDLTPPALLLTIVLMPTPISARILIPQALAPTPIPPLKTLPSEKELRQTIGDLIQEIEGRLGKLPTGSPAWMSGQAEFQRCLNVTRASSQPIAC